tara:strand:+ start:3542 stop:4240 length:699 start_codon:yes stop_codon:yes gene_type:complete
MTVSAVCSLGVKRMFKVNQGEWGQTMFVLFVDSIYKYGMKRCRTLRAVLRLPCFLGWLLLSACQVQMPENSEFVGMVHFSELQTFRYKHTLVSGLEWRSGNHYILEELSSQVISEEMSARGFFPADREAEADIVVVAKWRKDLRAYQEQQAALDGPLNMMNLSESSAGVVSRISLVLEMYAGAEEKLFWRRELPHAFEATQFTGDRITRCLEGAVENFPQRIENDPALPSIR